MRKPGGIWIAFGLLLLAAALCLTVYNLRQATDAADASQTVVEELGEKILEAREPSESPESTEPTAPLKDYEKNPDMDMPTETIRGYDYIGVLTVPALELELPVLSQWSYAGLKVAPGRYTGSAYRDDMVICAHNYARHFGGLKNLSVGDEVTFVDVDGNVFSYTVSELETLPYNAVEEMATGDWDLTLFTCVLGGGSRVTVRCDRISS